MRSAMVKTGSSYLSQSELPLTFGLGHAAKVSVVEVTWPGGKVEKVSAVLPNQAITMQEGKGIVRTAAIGAKGR